MNNNKGGQLVNSSVISALEDMFDASVIEEQRRASNTSTRRTIPLLFQQSPSESPMWIPRLKLITPGLVPQFVSSKEPFNVYQSVINRKGESKLAVLPVIEYHGWIMFAEYGAGISEWDAANKVMHNHCNTLGSAPLGRNDKKVNAILYPIRSMYEYDKDAPYTKPSQDISNLNAFGSRNEWCSECIKNGHSQVCSVVEEGNTLRCKAWGYMYMMVTHVTVTEGDEVNRYSVRELYNNKSEALDYFPIAIELKESSIQGAAKQGILGAAQVHEDCKLEPYKYTIGTVLRDIPRLSNDADIARFRFIHSRPYTVKAVFKENAQTGEKAKWSQGHFAQDYDSNSQLTFKEQIDSRLEEHDECLQIWKSISPVREIQEIGDLELGSFGGSVTNSPTTMKSANVLNVDVVGPSDTDDGWGDINIDIN